MSAALARARDAGITVALEADGRLTWQASRPVDPDMLGELRARRDEIRRALIEATSVEPSIHIGGGAVAEARGLGWHVEIRPAGWVIDTRGQPGDAALMDRLHAAMLADQPEDREAERWPAALLADPAEVVVRGSLERIEREFLP